jgi:hypothetical protein
MRRRPKGGRRGERDGERGEVVVVTKQKVGVGILPRGRGVGVKAHGGGRTQRPRAREMAF